MTTTTLAAPLLVLYDYMPHRSKWKVFRVQDAGGIDYLDSRRTVLEFDSLAQLRSDLQHLYHRHALTFQWLDRCQEDGHELASARFGYWSRDGTLAYVLCNACQRQRVVAREAWLTAQPAAVPA